MVYSVLSIVLLYEHKKHIVCKHSTWDGERRKLKANCPRILGIVKYNPESMFTFLITATAEGNMKKRWQYYSM